MLENGGKEQKQMLSDNFVFPTYNQPSFVAYNVPCRLLLNRSISQLMKQKLNTFYSLLAL